MIKIYSVQDKTFVWNAEDVMTLRKKYRIVGALVGIYPLKPFQVQTKWLPLQLMNEEAKLLLDKGIADLYQSPEKTTDPDLIESYFNHQNKLYEEQVALMKENRKQTIIEKADEILAGKKRKYLKNKSKSYKKFKDNLELSSNSSSSTADCNDSTIDNKCQSEEPAKCSERDNDREGLNENAKSITECDKDVMVSPWSSPIDDYEIKCNESRINKESVGANTNESDFEKESIDGETKSPVMFDEEPMLSFQAGSIDSSEIRNFSSIADINFSDAENLNQQKVTDTEMEFDKESVDANTNEIDFDKGSVDGKTKSPDVCDEEPMFSSQAICIDSSEMGNSSSIADINFSEAENLNLQTVIDTEMAKLSKISKESCMVQLFTECPWKDDKFGAMTLQRKTLRYPSSQMEMLRYAVFKDLWEKEFYITSGMKFGGDFLAYKGDPLRYHAVFIIKCILPQAKFQALDVLTYGRVGHQVKKTFALASFDTLRNVEYISVNWSNDLSD